MKDLKKPKKLKVLKLSKDSQKQVLGGEVRGQYCEPGYNCIGAFHRVVDNYYKNS